MFANRVSELDLLERHHASDKAELFVLYGRRRVGKTELLARFCEIRFVLQQELREPRNYFAVLQAIASGQTRQNEIKEAYIVSKITSHVSGSDSFCQTGHSWNAVRKRSC